VTDTPAPAEHIDTLALKHLIHQVQQVRDLKPVVMGPLGDLHAEYLRRDEVLRLLSPAADRAQP
jgi:hypothetical protein